MAQLIVDVGRFQDQLRELGPQTLPILLAQTVHRCGHCTFTYPEGRRCLPIGRLGFRTCEVLLELLELIFVAGILGLLS